MDNEKSQMTSIRVHNYGALHSVTFNSIPKIETSSGKIFHLNKRSVLLISIILVVCAAAATLIVWLTKASQHHDDDSFLNNCATGCQTKWCHTYCETLNHTMDYSVDPCDDFYQHVCGNWNQKFSYLDTQLENVFEIAKFALKERKITGKSKALQYMADLYEDCVDWPRRDQLGVEPVRDILKQALGTDWSFVGNASRSFGDTDDKLNETYKSASSFLHFEEHWKMWKVRPKLDQNDRPDVEQWMDCFVEASLIKVPFLIKEFTISAQDDGGGRVGIVLDKALDYDKEIEDLNYHFRTLVRKISIFLDIEQRRETSSSHALAHAIFEVIEFELALVNIYKQPLDLTRPFYEHIQLSQLNSLSHRHFNWTHLLNKFASKIGSAVAVTDDDHVSMFTGHFVLMKPLSELISSTPIRVLKNVMALKIIDSAKMILIDNRLSIEKQNPTLLWRKFYAANIKSLLPLYTRLIVDYQGREKMQKAREQVREMIANMKATFAESIKQTYTWLNDGQTEKKALNKMKQLSTMISHPDWIFDDSALDEELGFDESASKYPLQSIKGNFVASYFNLIRIMQSARYRKTIKDDQIRTKEQREFEFAYKSVGEYIPMFNQLRIDTALVSEPAFNVDHPIELNYGMVGTIIAHEFLHQFEVKASYLDKDGNMLDWLTSSDAQRHFVNRSQCFVGQYNQLVDPDYGYKVNGLRTLEENIADNGGVRLAYRAMEKLLNDLESQSNSSTLPTLQPYLAQFTHEQLFFLSFGLFSCSNMEYPTKLHSPNKFRVNIPLRNFVKFSQAFNCPVGSKMNPKDKCELW